MSDENVELVRRVYDAARATRCSRYTTRMWSGIGRVSGLFGQGGLYRGQEDLRRWFREWSEGLDHIEYQAKELIAAGDHVL